MRVSIDPSVCQGHGRCVDTVHAVFVMDGRERGAVVGDEVPAELEDAVRRAVLLCPEEAITIDEQ